VRFQPSLNEDVMLNGPLRAHAVFIHWEEPADAVRDGVKREISAAFSVVEPWLLSL
jgi:hypothetical protein